MQLLDLQKQIVSKSIDKCLLLFGEEVAIMNIYLNKIYDTLGLEVVRADTVREAFSRMTQKRLSGGARCFVVRDDRDFFKDEKAWKPTFSQANSSSDYLIVIYSSMDKRSKFYKQHQEMLCEFAKLSPEMLVKYVQKEIDVTEKTALKLIEMCECDYSRILLECDKIRHYYNVHANEFANMDSVFMKLRQDGIIYEPIGDITFKLTDAILTRNFRDAAIYLQQAKRKQEPEIMVLSILYNGFKHILMVQGLGKDQSEPCKRTGLTAWQVKMAKEKQGHYRIAELIDALKIIRFVEKGIKTGQIDADVALEYVALNIMKEC